MGEGLRARAWVPALTAGLLVCLSLLVLPVDTLGWVLLARGAGVVAIAAYLFAVARMPRRTRTVWWLLWGYAALTVCADIVYDVQQRIVDEPPFPGPADALYLVAYASAIAGLLVLVRRVVPGRDFDAGIDTLVITIAVAAVVGYFIARPIIADTEQTNAGIVIALSYPFLDIVVLSSLIRLVVARGRAPISMTLLIAGFLVTLTGDLLYNLVIQNGSEDFSPPWLDATLLAAIMFMAAAPWAPGARTLDETSPRPTRADGSVRLVGLAAGVLTIPILLVVTTWGIGSESVRLLTLASVAVILLVVWRLQRVLSTVRHQNALLDREARTDPLTGLPNRRTLDHEITRAVQSAQLTGRPLTVAMLDLDHFKAFNDENGHQAGDRLLAACGRSWHAALPADAFLARYGGEEFAVLLPGVDADQATDVLDRLRTAMPPHRTVSIGYAVLDTGESGPGLLRRADVALYTAKEQGRDRIVAAW